VAVAVGCVVLAGGIGWWALREGPAVSVPAKVCDGSLSGSLVSTLLPDYGTAYSEKVQGFGKDGSGAGFCSIRGGGLGLHLSYHRWTGDFYSDKTIEDLASAKGRQALKAGTAKGDVSDTFGELFVQCPSKADPDSKVQVSVEYLHRDGTKGAVADLRALTVAAARYVAQDLLDCEGAEALATAGS
jgi:hypothetical protein